MIQIARLACPAKLTDKGPQWLATFLASGRSRPPSGQYDHPEVLDVLEAMSHRKCFFCEQRLARSEYTVEHYADIAEDKNKTFEWANLYLACLPCNKRQLSEQTIPRADCLDPCSTAIDPAEHITFTDEVIRCRDDSTRGQSTIDKYKLDRDDLERRRAKQIIKFQKLLIKIQREQNEDGGRPMTPAELDALRYFARPAHAFSLMFRDLLARESLR